DRVAHAARPVARAQRDGPLRRDAAGHARPDGDVLSSARRTPRLRGRAPVRLRSAAAPGARLHPPEGAARDGPHAREPPPRRPRGGEVAMKRMLDVMTRQPWTVQLDDSLAVARRMIAEREIRHLPVLDGGVVVGMVTERDLASTRDRIGTVS